MYRAPDDRGEGREGTTVEDALSKLKRRGSVSLVVGTVPHESYDRVSRRMFGTAGDERRRLLVVPETDRQDGLERLRETGPLDPEHTRVLSCNGSARSAAAAPAAGADERIVRRVEGSVGCLGAAITEEVDRFETMAGGLSPAELRVGLDTLPDLLSAYDRRTAFSFLHVLGEQIRAIRGMGHVRLPRPRGAESVRTLAPLFDAVLELRLDGYRLEQRWHFRESGLTSDWLALPGTPNAD